MCSLLCIQACQRMEDVLISTDLRLQCSMSPMSRVCLLLYVSCVLPFLLWREGFYIIFPDLLQSLQWVCGSGSILPIATVGLDSTLLYLLYVPRRGLLWLCVTIGCMWRGPSAGACCRLCRPILCVWLGLCCCLFLWLLQRMLAVLGRQAFMAFCDQPVSYITA